ncbi:hypothetical protein ACFOWZ_33755 [Lentzea rhizosphaerae]|uniref:Uncharacterized protein n=1 Tax=Lentzea rhizosphaerae TaxID=2041025 RepID=A0ABV8C389_9PSEU
MPDLVQLLEDRVVRRAARAGQSGDELRRFFTADAVTTEHPNLIKPAGVRLSATEMVGASTKGAGLLSSQKYDVHSKVRSARRPDQLYQDVRLLRAILSSSPLHCLRSNRSCDATTTAPG